MQSASPSSSKPMPWEFHPLPGLVQAVAYVGLVGLLLVMLVAGPCALIYPFIAFSDPANRSASAWKVVQLIGLWWVIVATAVAALWGFVVLNRRLDLTRYLKQCPAGSVYILGGSALRVFYGVGRVTVGRRALLLEGRLGPDLRWPLLLIIGISAVIVIGALLGRMTLFGKEGVVAGTFGTLHLGLAIYVILFMHHTPVTVEPPAVASVRCRGPVVRIRFQPKPVGSLGGVTILIPPDQQAEFFGRFNRLFPQKLPLAYREALPENASSPVIGTIPAAPAGACPPLPPGDAPRLDKP